MATISLLGSLVELCKMLRIIATHILTIVAAAMYLSMNTFRLDTSVSASSGWLAGKDHYPQ